MDAHSSHPERKNTANTNCMLLSIIFEDSGPIAMTEILEPLQFTVVFLTCCFCKVISVVNSLCFS